MNIQTVLTALKAILPADSWTGDSEKIAPYLHEWRDRWQGQTPLLLQPANVDEVVRIVKICAKARLPLSLQGGNTGLVGGQIPQGEILLSTHRLNAVRSRDVLTEALVCEAGVTLADVQKQADGMDKMFPLSLASQGSCTIGGNLSTNAGGVHVVKYGPARNLVYGIEAVLADGSVFSDLSTLKKDNTGYDLSQIFIGAEGTLGIITAAALKVFPRPAETHRSLLALESPAQALQLLSQLQAGSYLSMFEMWPQLALQLVCAHIPKARSPFGTAHPWYGLIEMQFPENVNGQAVMQNALEEALSASFIEDAVLAQTDRQSSALMALRENISAAQKPEGAAIKHDISVPVDKVPNFIRAANESVLRLLPQARPLPFGHLGDGNIHYNILQPPGGEPEKFMALETKINDIVYDLVTCFGGSISAEHGIGILKKSALLQYADKSKIATMRQIKQALDPHNIFNPRVLL